MLLPLRDGHGLVVSADGHYVCPEEIETEIVFVVLTRRGQETLSPAEFAKRFSWQNQPLKAQLPAR